MPASYAKTIDGHDDGTLTIRTDGQGLVTLICGIETASEHLITVELYKLELIIAKCREIKKINDDDMEI